MRPELAVIIACCRVDHGPVHAQQLMDLLRSHIDWPLLLDWALWHNVTPSIFRALSQTVPESLPIESFAALKVHFEKNRKRMQFLTEEMLSIVAAFSAAAIPIVPFKGPALAYQLAGDAALRVSHDLDFLVRDADVAASLEVLARKGYVLRARKSPAQARAHRKHSDQHQIVRADGAAIVELHWAIAPRPLTVELDYDAIWRRVERMEVMGVTLLAFSRRDLLLALCVHGSKETWSRLKWVQDVAKLAHQLTSEEIEAAYESACRQGCRRMLLSGLALANRLLLAQVPASIQAAIAADRTLLAMVGWAEQHLLVERAATPPHSRLSRFRIASRERLRDRARHVVRTIFTPNARHYDFLPLPDLLFWCYYPIRCIHDYLLLPAWLLCKRIAPPRSGP